MKKEGALREVFFMLSVCTLVLVGWLGNFEQALLGLVGILAVAAWGIIGLLGTYRDR